MRDNQPKEYTMEEIWKETKYKGYSVSNLGNVRSTKTADGSFRTRKASITKYGILTVVLQYRTQRLVETVAKLVATAFVPNPRGYKWIAYKDEDSKNILPENLKWMSTKQRRM